MQLRAEQVLQLFFWLLLAPSSPWQYTVSWPSVPMAAPDTSGRPAAQQASLQRQREQSIMSPEVRPAFRQHA